MNASVRCRALGIKMAFVVLLSSSLFTVACPQNQGVGSRSRMERICVSDDLSEFVLAASGSTFVPWGFNFVGEFGQILEEYWLDDWPSVVEDFQRMHELGANVVRLHLQLGT